MPNVEVLPPPEVQPPAAEPALPALDAEWLETDGLGGFASSTVSGIRTRREHALLLVDGAVLVNGVDARVATPRGVYDIGSNHYAPDVVHPDGHRRVESFTTDPWPTWIFRLEDGTRVEQQIFSVHGAPGVIVTWAVLEGSAAGMRLMARPLISARGVRALHHENPHFRSEAVCCDTSVRWQPYASQPAILAGSNGCYVHHHLWYHRFLYGEDRARGAEHIEDLASPGIFHFDLSRGEAVLVLTTDEGLRALKTGAAARSTGLPGFLGPAQGDPGRALGELRDMERASRVDFPTPLHRAADAYVVRHGDRIEIVAGYPGGEASETATFAAMRGLCLATDRLEEARRILLAGAERLGGHAAAAAEATAAGATAAGATVGATVAGVTGPLWFIVAAHEFLERAAATRRRIAAADRKALQAAIEAILSAYASGGRGSVHMDEDGLLFAGGPGSPRAGKAVDVQALWLNALRIGAAGGHRVWADLADRGQGSFERRFWNEEAGALHDVVDADHARGVADPTFRAHQLWAVGGLPFPALEGERASRVVEQAEKRLLTPVGMRAQAEDPVAWPRLHGPFVDAWVRVRGRTDEARREARDRFLAPLLALTGDGSLRHIPEALEVEPPHRRLGAPFSAWSVGESLRLQEVVLRA